jgi:hypothetical protein
VDIDVNAIEILLIIATLGLFLRIWVPGGASVSGGMVRRERLSLLGRLHMHGPTAALVALVAVALLLAGRIGPQTVLIVVALLAVLVALPMRYLLTAQGIRAGWTPFRRWTEFGGVARRRGGVRLQGVAGARPLTVWLSGNHDDDELVLLLRQLVRGSYKGRLGPEAGAGHAGPAPGASPGTIGIAGVGGS